MKYIECENNVFAIFDEVQKKVIKTITIGEVRQDLKDVRRRLNEIPNYPDDDELLRWAKKNYPMMDFSKEKEMLINRRIELKQILDDLLIEE